MSKAWIQAKHPEFVRDLFKFFCQACELLEAQSLRFDRDGTVEFHVLRELVGIETNKGLLWRMKDTAHHVFRNDPHSQLGGKFLDWAMGYIFHEAVKLKEDAYQKQNYAPWFHKLYEGDLNASEKENNRAALPGPEPDRGVHAPRDRPHPVHYRQVPSIVAELS